MRAEIVKDIKEMKYPKRVAMCIDKPQLNMAYLDERDNCTMTLRRSTRNVGKNVDYSSHSLFPDGDPHSDFEALIHTLNLEAFPSSEYARVDDILVSALFETKRRPRYYRALLPATAGDSKDITKEEAIDISNIIRGEISHDHPTQDQCEAAAVKIMRNHDKHFVEEDLGIIKQ